MSFDPISAIADLIKTTVDKVIPDASAKAAAKAEIDKMQVSGEFALLMKQLDINLEEAKSTNWFIAGWRPAVGWICTAGLVVQFIIFPLIALVGVKLPPIDTGTLVTLLGVLLGVAGLRTAEKIKDAEGNR